MAVDILVTDITNGTTTTDGTGVFDVLMKSAIMHINEQVDANRITQGEAGLVYTAAIQNAMQQAVQYVLQEKPIEADVALKEKQLEISTAELAIKQMQLTLTQKQVEQITSQITIAEAQSNDQLLTSEKQRILLDTQEQAEQYKVDFILPKQVEQITSQIAIAETQSADQLLTSEKQRILLDKDALIKDEQLDLAEQQVITEVHKAAVTQKQVDLTAEQITASIAQTTSINLDSYIKNDQYTNYQKTILANQVTVSNLDATNAPTLKAKDIALKTAQIDQTTNEATFITSKKEVMENTRKDNIRIQTSREFADFFKYCFAGDLIPEVDDFNNARYLISKIGEGINNPNASISLSGNVTSFVLNADAPTNG